MTCNSDVYALFLCKFHIARLANLLHKIIIIIALPQMSSDGQRPLQVAQATFFAVYPAPAFVQGVKGLVCRILKEASLTFPI